MGRKNGGLLPEEQNGASTSANNALVFITMSIIGFPVDVHVKDGSIYSGTFHTASIDDAYGAFTVILVILYFFLSPFVISSFPYWLM